MTDETSLRRQAERGARVAELLDNELVADAFKAIQARVFIDWKNTKPHEHEERERLYRLLLSQDEYLAMFKTAVANGELAISDLTKPSEDNRV